MQGHSLRVPGWEMNKGVILWQIVSAVKIGDKIEEMIAGTKEWFEAEKDNIDRLTEVYKERGMSESKARNKAMRELLEDSYKKANGRR